MAYPKSEYSIVCVFLCLYVFQLHVRGFYEMMRLLFGTWMKFSLLPRPGIRRVTIPLIVPSSSSLLVTIPLMVPSSSLLFFISQPRCPIYHCYGRINCSWVLIEKWTSEMWRSRQLYSRIISLFLLGTIVVSSWHPVIGTIIISTIALWTTTGHFSSVFVSLLREDLFVSNTVVLCKMDTDEGEVRICVSVITSSWKKYSGSIYYVSKKLVCKTSAVRYQVQYPVRYA